MRDGPTTQGKTGYGDYLGNVKTFTKPKEDKEFSLQFEKSLNLEDKYDPEASSRVPGKLKIMHILFTFRTKIIVS